MAKQGVTLRPAPPLSEFDVLWMEEMNLQEKMQQQFLRDDERNDGGDDGLQKGFDHGYSDHGSDDDHVPSPSFLPQELDDHGSDDDHDSSPLDLMTADDVLSQLNEENTKMAIDIVNLKIENAELRSERNDALSQVQNLKDKVFQLQRDRRSLNDAVTEALVMEELTAMKHDAVLDEWMKRDKSSYEKYILQKHVQMEKHVISSNNSSGSKACSKRLPEGSASPQPPKASAPFNLWRIKSKGTTLPLGAPPVKCIKLE